MSPVTGRMTLLDQLATAPPAGPVRGLVNGSPLWLAAFVAEHAVAARQAGPALDLPADPESMAPLDVLPAISACLRVADSSMTVEARLFAHELASTMSTGQPLAQQRFASAIIRGSKSSPDAYLWSYVRDLVADGLADTRDIGPVPGPERRGVVGLGSSHGAGGSHGAAWALLKQLPGHLQAAGLPEESRRVTQYAASCQSLTLGPAGGERTRPARRPVATGHRPGKLSA